MTSWNYIEYFSWLAVFLVIGQVGFISIKNTKYHNIGWILGIYACIAWAFIAVATQQAALFGQQLFLIVLCINGLRNTASSSPL